MKHFDPFDSHRARREWIAQERACREDGNGSRSFDDSRVRKYRLIAQLLRHPPIDPIPRNFAAQTAARAELTAEANDDSLETWLERGLLGALAIVGCLTMLTVGGNWAGSLDALRSSGTLAFEPYKNWGAVAVGCVIVSTVLQHGRALFPRSRE